MKDKIVEKIMSIPFRKNNSVLEAVSEMVARVATVKLFRYIEKDSEEYLLEVERLRSQREELEAKRKLNIIEVVHQSKIKPLEVENSRLQNVSLSNDIKSKAKIEEIEIAYLGHFKNEELEEKELNNKSLSEEIQHRRDENGLICLWRGQEIEEKILKNKAIRDEIKLNAKKAKIDLPVYKEKAKQEKRLLRNLTVFQRYELMMKKIEADFIRQCNYRKLEEMKIKNATDDILKIMKKMECVAIYEQYNDQIYKSMIENSLAVIRKNIEERQGEINMELSRGKGLSEITGLNIKNNEDEERVKLLQNIIKELDFRNITSSQAFVLQTALKGNSVEFKAGIHEEMLEKMKEETAKIKKETEIKEQERRTKEHQADVSAAEKVRTIRDIEESK